MDSMEAEDVTDGAGPEQEVAREDARTQRSSLRSARTAGVPNGIRTRVTAVKGRCPRPLDEGAAGGREKGAPPRSGKQRSPAITAGIVVCGSSSLNPPRAHPRSALRFARSPARGRKRRDHLAERDAR